MIGLPAAVVGVGVVDYCNFKLNGRVGCSGWNIEMTGTRERKRVRGEVSRWGGPVGLEWMAARTAEVSPPSTYY